MKIFTEFQQKLPCTQQPIVKAKTAKEFVQPTINFHNVKQSIYYFDYNNARTSNNTMF